ncbi:MAG: UDP-3-O-(3-hydroxymyristoyl)glucosamine N-acyltransferase [Thermodesulfobacteriota bacterium]
MKKSLKELAEIVGGKVFGDRDIAIKGISGIKDATEGDITFLANPRYARQLSSTCASAVIADSFAEEYNLPVLAVNNPDRAFSKILNLFNPKPFPLNGIHPSAAISSTALVGDNVSIYPNVYIGDKTKIGNGVTLFPGVFVGNDAEIGDDTIIYANVSIREGCKLGKRVIVHCNAVIGSDGFGFVKEKNRYEKIPQVGIVRIEDDVEVGALVAIDRATMGETVVGKGTKIDNLVQIAHNVKIGKDSIIVGQVGIAGSTQIGDRVILAAQVGVLGHLKIGDDVVVGGQSGVAKDLPDKSAFSGSPCIPHMEWLKSQAVFPKIPEMKRELKKLKKDIEKLKAKYT